jgi:hypothetical protein
MGAPDSPVAHRTVTVHCPVCATSMRPLGFEAIDRLRRLSFCCTGQSGDTPDSLVTSDFCALTSPRHCLALFLCVVDRWRAGSHCSAGSPDSPVAHQIVRWIIVERAWQKSESGWFAAAWPGAPDSVRCAIFQHTLSPSLQIWLWPQLNFFLDLCWTLCTCDKWYLDKLVSLCPVCHFSAHSKSFAPNLIVTPTKFLSWFVLNLMHLW